MPLAISPDEKDFIEKVFRVFLPPGTEIRYFGSRVSGSHRAHSDLDVALARDGAPIDPLILANMRAVFEGSDLPYRVDLSDFSTLSSDFREIIAATGMPPITLD